MTSGIIAAGHIATAHAGAEILHAGGNAIDAVVAAAFASFVAEPTLVNIGGGGYALVHRLATGKAHLYDFFCAFPGASATLTRPVDFFPIRVDYGPDHQIFHVGRGSVAVPGNVAGLCRLHTDGGRLTLADVLTPAIQLARGGAILGEFGAYVGRLLAPIFTHEPELARLFGAPDAFMRPDLRIRNPELAEVLLALVRQGPDLFYRGEIARRLLADQRHHGGLLSAEDLANYNVIVREPLRAPFHGIEFLSNPLPARGGALIAFALTLLQDYDLAALPRGSTRYLRLLAEVMRQTNLARPLLERSGALDLFLSPDHMRVHVRQLDQRLRNASASLVSELVTLPQPNHTSHISVMDEEGTMAALTTSAGENAGFLLPGTGLTFNNVLGEADLHPDGFHVGAAGERVGSMMAPSLILRGGEPMLAIGSGGANRIRTAILQVLLNIVAFELDVSAAVAAPRIHHEDGKLQIEHGVAPAVVGWLRRRGFDVVHWPDKHMYFGGVHAVGRGPVDDFVGAGDPRRNGVVVQV